MKQIKKIISTKTFQHTAITTSATAINGVLGLIFYILLARYLGPVSFGIFSVSIVSLNMVADIANVGTDTGIINFVGKYFNSDRQKALKFLKLGLEIKIFVSFFVIIIGWFLIPSIAVYLLKKEELIFPLRLALLGGVSALLFSYATSALQAVQKFFTWSFLNISTNTLRLFAIVMVYSLGALSATASISLYIAAPLLGFFIALFLLPPFIRVKKEKEISSEFFKYNKWVAVFVVIAAIGSRLDTFITARLLSLKDTGIYSVANNLSSIVPQIIFAIAAVVAPKLASFDSNKKAITYLKKLQLFVSALSIIGLVTGTLLAFVIIPKFYGSEYNSSFLPFIILLIAQAIFLSSIPAHTAILYFFQKPKIFVLVNFGQLIINLGFGIFLVQKYGYIGAALSVLIGTIFTFIFPAAWVIKKFNKNE